MARRTMALLFLKTNKTTKQIFKMRINPAAITLSCVMTPKAVNIEQGSDWNSFIKSTYCQVFGMEPLSNIYSMYPSMEENTENTWGRKVCVSQAFCRLALTQKLKTSCYPTYANSTPVSFNDQTFYDPANSGYCLLNPLSSFSASNIRSLSDFINYKSSYGVENRAFVNDPLKKDSGIKVIQVKYPAKSYSLSISRGTGFYAQPLDLKNAKTVMLEYKVHFPQNFNFVKGGKLPGLYGGRSGCSGGYYVFYNGF
jgi:hypothetical protein